MEYRKARITGAVKQRIETELRHRLDMWIKHSTFEEMTCGYSRLRFEMSLGADGYPFEPREWMTSRETKKIVTDGQFRSDDYEDIISNLYLEAYEKYGEK